jgi:hypothetical protein
LAEVDDENDENGDRRVSFDGVDVAVTEECDSEGDEGDDDDSCWFGELVRVGDGAKSGSSDDSVYGRLNSEKRGQLVLTQGGA